MTKKRIIATLCALIMGVVIFLCGFTAHNFSNPHTYYQIYLDGESIGVIDDENKLYNLIDNDQSDIKKEYNINRVYPPKGFEVAKLLTYDATLSDINTVYAKIKEERDFTIKGYTISITYEDSEDEEKSKAYTINVLDKSVFEEAMKMLVTSFISAEQYQNYINGTQAAIVDTGSLIENMYFQENITVKEGYISTQDKIYTNVQELSQFLLFGPNMEDKYYEVKAGDTIESIAEDNHMSTQELLIANPNLTSSYDLLAIGENINIALINPQLHFVYDLIETEDFEDKYDTKIKYDYSKSSSYRLVETRGVNGLIRTTTRTEVINGATSSEAETIGDPVIIREKQDEVVVRGRSSYIENDNGIYFDDGTAWAWPTNSPYKITSPFGWRGGVMHDGTDISGTGAGSPIYAIADGVVRNAGWGGIPGNSAGYNVVIEHPNGYWSIYAHMIGMPIVKEGDTVSRKQRIGSMGETGEAYGVHLHLSVSVGKPFGGGYFINPLVLWQ